jgi:hypothetical protein
MTRTYYEIFGVSRTASGDEIRSAYVALMKKHHPDVSGGAADHRARDMVTLLNRCYAVLRDPRKRAEYDASLIRDSLGAEQPATPRHVVVATPPNAQERRWGIPLFIAAAVATVIVAQLGWEWMGDNGYAAGSILSWAQTEPQHAPLRPLRASEVSAQARLATEVSTDEALSVSRRCFDQARAQLDLTSARLCIIFDDAFLYWRQNGNPWDSLPLYFGDQATRMRHLDALEEAGDEADKELVQLRDITFRALLAQLTGRQDQTPLPAPVTHEGNEPRPSGNTQSHNETGAIKNSAVAVHI